VTGDVAGSEESLVYAILKLIEVMEHLKLPEDSAREQGRFAVSPLYASLVWTQ
jgi:hypothetical protein